MLMSKEGMVSSKRIFIVMFLLASSAMALIFRLVHLQIIEHEKYVQQAQQEHWSKETLVSRRGTIYDRNGYPLATSVTTYNVFFNAKASGNLDKAAKGLSSLLGMPLEETLARMAKADKEPVLVKADVPYELGNKVAEAAIPGVELSTSTQRVYPEGSLAAPLLGFVGKDNKGLTGIEETFNWELAGTAGTLVYERDSTGAPIPVGFRRIITPPKEGQDLILTIDRFAQRLVERKLDEAITKHQARGGIIIVMEPSTGEVLAMASRPTFDLVKLDLRGNPQMELYRNRSITDLYEPGSVFKVITMAAGLEEKRFTPSTTFYDGGPVNKYGWNIDTWNGQQHGNETMTQVLINSCNVGAVWASDAIGKDKFYEYVSRFGFGQPTNIGLSGEAPGQIRFPKDPDWKPIDLATNSFGQGMAVTPLQVVTAYSAIANGGNLMRPYVAKEVRGPNSKRVFKPVVVRRVISPQTSAQLIGMMNEVAERGANKSAMVPGFHVAGKTGTASIPTPGGYTTPDTIASFVGMAPVPNPRFVILVRIDAPKDSPWGSMVASPIFSAIAKELLVYFRVPPQEPTLVQKS